VFVEALSAGLRAYLAAIAEPYAVSAIKLTLLTAAIAVPLNLVFGVAAAWALTKFRFPGKSFLITDQDRHGTVGAVALDRDGNLAAATSTGGTTNKMPGRIGDTPVIGAGNYADSRYGAAACTHNCSGIP